ncbi:hypothetical protein PIB30_025639 [Stylosanthes scabra]|uniref:Uncharacterized protein n=1 Tax=Stylosanthes scabra TaxID=79078 RepID=A0ABU6U935_9FABA|nr:hypothetical protein [Stylosanthes scabra]
MENPTSHSSVIKNNLIATSNPALPYVGKAVLGPGSDESVKRWGIGVGYEVEYVDGGGKVVGEGECGGEFWCHIRIFKEVVLEDLGLDLLHCVEVSATVEVGELFIEEVAHGKPCWRTRRRSRQLHMLSLVYASFMQRLPTG